MPTPHEFTVAGHTFRHTPLAAMPLAREHHKLLVRLDHDTGALDTLAFTFGSDDYDLMAAQGPGGILRYVKILSMLVGTDGPATRRGAEDEEGEEQAVARDTLPSTLDTLYLYYAQLGKVEQRAEIAGQGVQWLAFHTEDQLNAHPFTVAPGVVAFFVLKGLFVPFVELLQALSVKAKEQSDTSSSSTSEATASATPPTSET